MDCGEGRVWTVGRVGCGLWGGVDCGEVWTVGRGGCGLWGG